MPIGDSERIKIKTPDIILAWIVFFILLFLFYSQNFIVAIIMPWMPVILIFVTNNWIINRRNVYGSG